MQNSMTPVKTGIDLSEIEQGDVFSEISHYLFEKREGDAYVFNHLASGQEVKLGENYVSKLLTSGNIYTDEVEVGKEDKFWTQLQITKAITAGDLEPNTLVRVGDVRVKGIRSIFEEIYSETVFTVCFLKKNTVLSTRKLNSLKKEQLERAVEEIVATKTAKKGVADKASQIIELIQNNPVLPIVPGEERILTGYKTQFDSRDGKYQCVDMAINEQRAVNINTLQWLIFKGVRYNLK